MAGRRGHGEDTVYRDGDRWRGAVSLGVGPDGRRLRRKVSGRTKAEVLQKLRELERLSMLVCRYRTTESR
jgi:hypothetical protein